jgi:hypothetical protein
MKNKIKITEPQLKMLQESFNDYNKPTESDKLLDYSHNEMSPEQIGQIFILAANVGVIRDSVQKYFTEFVQMWHTREEAQKHIELLKQMVDKEESGGEGDSMDSEFYNRNQGGENLNEQVSRIKNMMGINESHHDLDEPRETHIDKSHGSPYDRGSADSYYGRRRNPHKWPEGTGHGEKVTLTDPDEIEHYMKGYSENNDFKDWGE